MEHCLLLSIVLLLPLLPTLHNELQQIVNLLWLPSLLLMVILAVLLIVLLALLLHKATMNDLLYLDHLVWVPQWQDLLLHLI
jgi:hypothetical protein